MPAFLSDVIEIVRNKLLGAFVSTADYEDHELLIKTVIRLTIESTGLAVANDGEIYSPAPPPRAGSNRQQNVHWRGSKRRR